MENELHRVEMLRIFDELGHEAYFSDYSNNGFPHSKMPIFARKEQIHQELDARQRKRKIEAQQDQLAWSHWEKRKAVLVQRYCKSTQATQRPDNRTEYQIAAQPSHNYSTTRPEYETILISIDQNTIEKTNHAVVLATGI